MERRLLEAHDSGIPEFDLPASWHYAITHAGHRFTQHIFHYPDEAGYRMRIFHYPPEQELWTFGDGLFQTPDEALDFGAVFVDDWIAQGGDVIVENAEPDHLVDTAERDHLIDAWISGTAAGTGSPVHDANWWAIDAMLTLPHKDPEQAWEIILGILARKPLPDLVVAVLAAGPLETLLAYHGDKFIDRVEARAQSDPDFKHLLGGVWKNAMTDDIWERVQAARDAIW